MATLFQATARLVYCSKGSPLEDIKRNCCPYYREFAFVQFIVLLVFFCGMWLSQQNQFGNLSLHCVKCSGLFCLYTDVLIKEWATTRLENMQ